MDTLHLYRAILRHLRVFPSSNRAQLILDVKHEWRAHRSTTDPQVVALQLEKAKAGLRELMQWLPSQLNTTQGEWAVKLRGNTIA